MSDDTPDRPDSNDTSSELKSAKLELLRMKAEKYKQKMAESSHPFARAWVRYTVQAIIAGIGLAVLIYSVIIPRQELNEIRTQINLETINKILQDVEGATPKEKIDNLKKKLAEAIRREAELQKNNSNLSKQQDALYTQQKNWKRKSMNTKSV